MTLFDDNSEKENEKFESMFEFLEKSGVPNESVQTLKLSLSPAIEQLVKAKPGEAARRTQSSIHVLEDAQEYSKCYPYMDVASLICTHLYDGWEALSATNHAARHQLNRRIMNMKLDPKANPTLLENLEVLRDEYTNSYTFSNVGFYRIRVLKHLYDKK